MNDTKGDLDLHATGQDPDSDDIMNMSYAGFWSRFGAHFVDSLILMPVLVAITWALSFSKSASVALTLPISMVAPAYSILLHARYGQTVFRVSGEPIGWREAALRNSVDIALDLVSTASTVFVMTRLEDGAWGRGWLQLFGRVNALEPSWSRWVGYAAFVWFWSELVTMLFNRKKRALHDLIAGTVVVRTI